MARTTGRGSMLRPLVIGFVAALMIGIVIIAMFGGRKTPTSTATTGTAQIAEGKQLYATYCAGCHGANLQGQPGWQQPLPNGSYLAPPHDASGHTWHHPDEQLFAITKNGGQAYAPAGRLNTMPAFGGQMSDAQINAVLAYIKSTWPPDIQAQQAQLSAQ